MQAVAFGCVTKSTSFAGQNSGRPAAGLAVSCPSQGDATLCWHSTQLFSPRAQSHPSHDGVDSLAQQIRHAWGYQTNHVLGHFDDLLFFAFLAFSLSFSLSFSFSLVLDLESCFEAADF